MKPAWDFHVNKIYPKQNAEAQTRWKLRLRRMCIWNSLRVWISYRSFWQKWNLIFGDKISHKRHPKWSAYGMSIKISGRFEIKPKWNVMWKKLIFTPVWNLMWKYSLNHWCMFSHLLIRIVLNDLPTFINQ